MYFTYLYENRKMKTVEIVLRKGEERMKENNGRDESN
jgi:hypothetical protein